MSTMVSILWLLCISLLSQNPRVQSAPLTPANIVRHEASKPPLIYITLEEHYDSKSVLSYQDEDGVYQLYEKLETQEIKETLRNISIRVPDMDANGIKMQVVANDPQPYALAHPNVIQRANEELATAISQYPDRFRGFCFLPMAYPDIAAQELRRCVREQNFLGALVDGHLLKNTFYDVSQVNSSSGLYTPDHDSWSQPVAAALAGPGWGWHSDNGLALVRMWLGGVFDRHPDLRLVVGHMGDMFPYMFHRTQYSIGYLKPHGVTLPDAYERNVWVTTSGFFSLVPFKTLMAATALDRIMYSVDYPWAYNANGTAFMEELKHSGLVTESEWEGIAFRNAEKLLKL